MTLIDTLLQFEIHVKVMSKDVAGKLCSWIKQAITTGLTKANIILGYTNSTPSFAFLCPCGAAELHHATIGEGFWICSLDEGNGGEFCPGQMFWTEEHTPAEAQAGSYR